MMKSILILVILILSVHSKNYAQVNISLDTSIKYQTFTGWEATTYVTDPCNPDFSYLRDTLLKLAVNEMGINRVRLEIRSGIENDVDHYSIFVKNGCPTTGPDYQTWRQNRYANVNDNSDTTIHWPGFHFTSLDHSIENIVIPLRKLLKANGERLNINLCYVAFTGQIVNGKYIQNDPSEYAELVLATYLHMRDKYGFVPDTWEVILEPDLVTQWNNGTVIGSAIAAAAARLIEYGFTPRFIAPSTTNMSNAIPFFDAMLKVPGVLPYLEELSYHRYSGVSSTSLQTIANRATEHKINTSMLELWFDQATYHVLHEDITTGRNSAWQTSVIAALFTINGSSISLSNTQKFNRQYTRFIREGARRINASSTDNFTYNPVGFINKDGTYVLVIKADREGSFNISGLRPDTYGIKYTTANQYNIDLADFTVGPGKSLITSIPATGVITIYGKAQISTVVDDQKEDMDLDIYPNPVSDKLYINTGNVVLLSAEITNIQGTIVMSLDKKIKGVIPLNIENLKSGIYLLSMKTNEEVITKKVMIIR